MIEDLGKSTFVSNKIKCIDQQKGLVFFLDQMIGEGANGQIYKGQVNFGTNNAKNAAVKVIQIPKYDVNLQNILQQELIIMKSINHKNIVQFYDCVVSENNYYIFMELCDGKSLQQMIQKRGQMYTAKLGEGITLNLMSQIIDSLYYLSLVHISIYNNVKGIVHRDLKPDNIMLSNNVPKLIDFGLARPLSTQDVTRFMGSAIYMSPENLSGEPYIPEKNDVWSLGVIIFQLIEGDFPWRREVTNEYELLMAQNTIQWTFSDTSPALQNLIKQMVNFNEAERPSWKEVICSQVLAPYLGKSVQGFTVLDNLLQQYNVLQSYIKQTNQQQFNKIILKLSLRIFIKHRQSIFKNTDHQLLFNEMMQQHILLQWKQQNDQYLKWKLRNKMRQLIKYIYLNKLQHNTSFIGLLGCLSFWYDEQIRFANAEQELQRIKEILL